MKVIANKCPECFLMTGTLQFEDGKPVASIFCECRSQIQCLKCKVGRGRFPGVYYLDKNINTPEYIYKSIEFLCKKCARGKDMSVTGNNMLDHSLLFISTAQTLENQSIPIYIIVYLASHGLELLLKFFLASGGEKNPKEFDHDIKKIYKRLKEIFPSFPLNDTLIFRVHKNLERGGIRFYQQGVDYQKTSPREVMEYAVLLIDWWSRNPVISTLSNNLSWDNLLSSVLKFFRIKIMPENKSSNFGKLQRRLTFVMVFVLFFPTLISSLYGISSDSLSLTNTILSWGSFLTFFILIFFSIELFERYLAYWVVKFINFLLLCEAVIFIPLFNIIAKYKTGPITSNLDYLVFSVSLFVMYALPFVMFVLLFLAGCYYSFKQFAKVKK